MMKLPIILIVDDEINILRSLHRLLKPYEVKIMLASSSEKALDIIKRNDIDLVISDQRMPTTTGIELLKKIKEISPSTLRILMSAYSDVDVLIEAINESNICHYIPKPWDNEKLVKGVLTVLKSKCINDFKLIQTRELFTMIIHDNISINDDIIEKAKMLKLDLSMPLVCGLLSIKETQTNHNKYNKISITKDIVQLLNLFPNCLAWDSKEFIAVIHDTNKKTDYNAIDKEVTTIKNSLIDYYPNIQFLLGLSNINTGLNSIKKSYHQAYTALTSLKAMPTNFSFVQYYKDLGVMQLLPLINEHTEAKEFIDQHLGALIRYDEKKSSNLVHSLEELLKNTHLKETAQKLHIHPKTLVFRRNRIQEILGITLENYESRIILSLAIKLYYLNK